MSYRYIFDELGQKDYELAVKWYAERSTSAAENLIAEIENALQLICDNPKRWRNEYKHYRELGLRKFPYVIIYSFEEDKRLVTITAIFHTKRNPKKKIRRK